MTMMSRLTRTLAQDLQTLLQGNSRAYDANALDALAALGDARRAAEAKIASYDDRLIVMAESRAARRRNWTPRSAVIAVWAGWRALWRRSAATAVGAPVAAALVLGAVAVPFISHAPAPRTGHAVVRTHIHRRRMAAATAPGRRGSRHHHGHGGVQGGGEPVGTVTGTPPHGSQPDPQPPGQPVPPPPPVPVAPPPPVQLPPPVDPPPVDLPPAPLPPVPPLPPVQLPPVGILPPVPPGQQLAPPVTGAVSGLAAVT